MAAPASPQAAAGAGGGNAPLIIPVIEAAKRGNEDQIEELLKLRHPVNKTDTVGNSALHWAAAGGHAGAVNILLQWKADPNLQNRGGDTPLHKAAWKNHIAAVNALVKGGANVTIKNEEQQTPLDLARNRDVKRLLVPPIEDFAGNHCFENL